MPSLTWAGSCRASNTLAAAWPAPRLPCGATRRSRSSAASSRPWSACMRKRSISTVDSINSSGEGRNMRPASRPQASPISNAMAAAPASIGRRLQRGGRCDIAAPLLAQIDLIDRQVLAAAVIRRQHRKIGDTGALRQRQLVHGGLVQHRAGGRDLGEMPTAVRTVIYQRDVFDGLDVLDQDIAVGIGRGIDGLAAVNPGEVAAAAGPVIVGRDD